jgi:septal ring factor EnvC (AmiA/AmiB activator)
MDKTLKKALLILLILGSSHCYANNTNKLHQLQSQIERLKTSLSSAHNQQAVLQHELKLAEINISDLNVQLKRTQQGLSQQQSLLKSLSQQQNKYQQQLFQQQQTLSTQLHAMYMLGQEQYLKVLLNQEDPNQFSRIFNYYRYINSRRMIIIKQFNTTLSALVQNKHQIQQQNKKLLTLETQLVQSKIQLEKSHSEREKLLRSLNNEIESKQQQLQTLSSNKQALENVIKRLSQASFFKRNPKSINSSLHQGKFPWPTQGRIIEGFGAPIQQSQLKSNGVLIAAKEGQNVYAVASGKVVFANWMAGYGLLIIIDHNNGFMTIYGRNQTLYKKVGDTLHAGDLIATVGNTGGYKASALYFGMRQNGQAVDPQRWCG